jgi:phage-related protein (TIGR01555 family)
MPFNTDGIKDFQEDVVDYKKNTLSQTTFNSGDIYNFYNYSGIFYSIINTIANEGISNGITIENDENSLFAEEIENIKMILNLQKAGKLFRLYGMCLMYLDINDGQYIEGTNQIDLETEVNFNNITDFKIKYIFPGGKFQPLLNDSDYLDWDYYQMYTNFDFTQNPQFKIHKSRVILFKNNSLLDDYMNLFNNNNLSEIYRCFQAVNDYHNFKDLIINLTEQSVFDIVKFDIKGRMNEAGLVSNTAGQSKIKDALNIIRDSKKNSKMIALLKEDGFQRIQNQVSGYEGILEQLKELISGVSKIPIKKLFGTKNSGLGTGGDETLENYYKELKSYQTNNLKDCINYILKIIAFKNKKPIPSFTFKPLFELDEKEIVAIETAKANIRKIDIETGFKTIDEIRSENGMTNSPLQDLESNLDSFDIEKKETFLNKIKNVFK